MTVATEKTHLGTKNYQPPQFIDYEGEPVYSNKCDVFSMGIIFYFILFGEHPFPSKADNAYVAKIKAGPHFPIG